MDGNLSWKFHIEFVALKIELLQSLLALVTMIRSSLNSEISIVPLYFLTCLMV